MFGQRVGRRLVPTGGAAGGRIPLPRPRLVVPVAAVALLGAACSGGSGDGADGGDAAADRASSAGAGNGEAEPDALRWRTSGEDVVCDGSRRKAGTVEQATGGETIEFTTRQPVEVPPGRADEAGHYELYWRCGPEEAHLRWELTATGASSGRTVDLTIAGAVPTAESTPVDVALYDDELVCSGRPVDVGVLSGLEPGQRVVLSSDTAGDRAPERADRDGNLVVDWSCRPGDVGRTWEVTARLDGDQRTTSFTLTGAAPPPLPPLAVEAAVDGVVCDGIVHPVATIVNLFPFEVVTFQASPRTAGLRDGTATGDGRLDLRWQCDRADTGKTWDLTVEATETERTTSLRFSGLAGPPTEPATVELVEEPFVCDGERRPVAVLGDLLDGEFVDFDSPQAGPLLEGRAEGGELTVNWQCGPDQADTVWEVTATGRESGRSATFRITGGAP